MHYHQQVKSSKVEKQVPNHGLWVTPHSEGHGQQFAEPCHRLNCTSMRVPCCCDVIHSTIRGLSLGEMF